MRLIRTNPWLLGCLLLLALTASCHSASKGRLVTPEGTIAQTVWTPAEKDSEIAAHRLWQGGGISYHEIRLSGTEKPHAHDGHDLTVVLLKGEAHLHFQDHTVALKPGDVIAIPKGVIHWAENAGKRASEVYAIFAPPLEGEDFRVVEMQAENG